jgi:XTP/dITP diphosphohydrolase
MKILLATGNEYKLNEMRSIFTGSALEILSPADVSCEIEVDEDGETFEDNARKKALAYSRETGLITLADDSGLEVDSLNGEPGVRSARYAGPERDYTKNNLKLLKAMKGVTERNARFLCSVACARISDVLFVVTGIVEGEILDEMRGDGGFGYDPVFFYKSFDKTFAECTADEKNIVSHRGIAFREARGKLDEIFKTGFQDQDTRYL